MHSSSRNGATVRVLCLHTTEGIMRARDLLAWTSWSGSSHASCDETGELLEPQHGFVPYDRASWTLRSGNPWSENNEMCGWARWARAEWLARPKLLDAAARWLAERSKARNIPLRKLSPAEYRAGGRGVIGHVDHTIGYQDGSHTDPGPNFPWDVVLAKAIAYRDGDDGAQPDQEDDDMKVIQSPGRGYALVGPGYRRDLSNKEQVDAAQALWGKATAGNDRQFDLWVAAATQGKIQPPAA